MKMTLGAFGLTTVLIAIAMGQELGARDKVEAAREALKLSEDTASAPLRGPARSWFDRTGLLPGVGKVE